MIDFGFQIRIKNFCYKTISLPNINNDIHIHFSEVVRIFIAGIKSHDYQKILNIFINTFF